MATPKERKPSDVSPESGFRALLSDLSVADLVQMKCLSGVSCSVRVVSEGRVAFLHFANGSIRHAVTGSLVGDDAVLEVLSWTGGNVEPIGFEPTATSVRSSWQNLLLLAAAQCDQSIQDQRNAMKQSRETDLDPGQAKVVPIVSRESSGSKTLLSPQSHAEPTRAATRPILSAGTEEGYATHQENDAVSRSPITRSSGAGPFVRLNALGRAISSRGNVEDLTGLAAFSVHLGQRIASAMGLGPLTGIEVRTDKQRTVVAVADTGQIDATQSTNDAELTALRRLAGL